MSAWVMMSWPHAPPRGHDDFVSRVAAQRLGIANRHQVAEKSISTRWLLQALDADDPVGADMAALNSSTVSP